MPRCSFFSVVTALTLVFVLADLAVAQDGASIFQATCASCHAVEGGQARNAPSIDALRRSTPESILNALVNGKMRIQGTPLPEPARRAVAESLGGRPLRTTAPGSSVVRCTASPLFSGPAKTGDWNGWGDGTSNTRFAKDGGLTAQDLPKLKLKWTFGYAD